MKKYTNYCNEEQTKRAYNLSAPLEITLGGKGSVCCRKGNYNTYAYCLIPTTQQVMNWLEKEHKISIDINSFRRDGYKVCIDLEWEDVDEMNCQYFETRKEAELAAIDTALSYLEKKG